MKDHFATPRGIRNNNPGNLRPVQLPDVWQGQVAVDTAKGGPFSIFDQPWHGWRAMALDVYGDILQHGLNTIQKLVHEYAPSSDNNNEADYSAFLAGKVGVAPDFPLNVYLHGPALLQAIAEFENGSVPATWPAGDKQKGIDLAMARLAQKGLV